MKNMLTTRRSLVVRAKAAISTTISTTATTRTLHISFRSYTEHSSPTKLERMKLATHQNTICYTKEGDENADLCFIAIHGGPGSHKDFRHLTPPFSEILVKKGFDRVYRDKESLSHQLLRIDLPGYGQSDRMPFFPSTTHFAEQIIEFIQTLQLKQQKKQIVLIGHSLGSIYFRHILKSLHNLNSSVQLITAN